nr:putative transporter [Quercus suber]
MDRLSSLSAGDRTARTNVSIKTPSQSSQESTRTRNERYVLRRVDWRLLPILFWLGIVASLDAVNIGHARVQGLEHDLHMVGQDFSIAVVVFYIPNILLGVPSNIILSLSRPSIFLGTLTLLCGEFFGAWLAVGIGIQSACIYLLAAYYPRNALQRRLASFLAFRLVANAFAGVSLCYTHNDSNFSDILKLLAYAIAHMSGVAGFSAWRWIFILEGILMSVSVVPVLLLPGWPTQAQFLSSNDKEVLLDLLELDTDADATAIIHRSLLREELVDSKVYFK